MWTAEAKWDQLYRARRSKRIRKSEECCVCYTSQKDVGMMGVMPCGHWVCFDCLIQIENAKYDSIGNRPIECPMCRDSFTPSEVNWMSTDWNKLEQNERIAKRRKNGSTICFSASNDQEWWEYNRGIVENGDIMSLLDIGFFLDYTFGPEYKSYKVKNDTLYNKLLSMKGGFIIDVTKKNARVCARFNDWR